MGRLLVDLRNQWGVQTLVVFSFSLQAFLLCFAPIRRHNTCTVPRLVLWLAYQLADSTALFTLGHMAISSRPLEEQPLMAFWAPFLLVHLGGQDTITAYSFEDNRLWLRHLETLVVQVLGTSYVLYKYLPGSETMVMVAAVLIFAVGILKYAERIWALRSASFDSIWSSIDDGTDGSSRERRSNMLLCHMLERRPEMEDDVEMVLMGAHGLMDVCMGLFIGVRGAGRREYLREIMWAFKAYDRLDKLMEMELSLMYDVLYTKAKVIHTWYGCCIRVVVLAATVAAFFVFLLSGKAGHSTKDIAITYVLLVGALLLEVASMVRAVGSTWTCAVLYFWRSRSRTWTWLHNELLRLRRLVRATRHRRWSGLVGQYNLLQACAHGGGRPGIVEAAGRLGDGLRRIAQSWWDELCESSSAHLSDSTKELVLQKILLMEKRGEELGSLLPGLLTLKQLIVGVGDDDIGWSIQDIGFEDSIMAWHLASDMCLFSDRSGDDQAEADLRQAIRVVSNYMMFLLVLRPYMLPGPVRRSRCDQLRRDLQGFVDHAMADNKDRVDQWTLHKAFQARISSDAPHAHYDAGVRLADVLYDRSDRLDLIFGVWVEMLCYVANHCSRESHARQLSTGGELVTIVWLMARHANLSYVD